MNRVFRVSALLVSGLSLAGVLFFLVSTANAQPTCTVSWNNNDVRATHTRLYVAEDPQDLRTDPNTLALEVTTATIETSCTSIGLTDGHYVAIDHRDGNGNESDLSEPKQLTILATPTNISITVTW